MTATILRAADGRRMPWKNGGGETIEIARSPEGADLDAFDWRVSMARVAADGPFSAFPGIDRTLTILDGEGLDLAVGSGNPVRLKVGSDPFAFPADAPCRARLLAGPVTDLNVMTRRTRLRHSVTPRDLAGIVPIDADGGLLLVLCRDGAIAVPGHADLGRHDALLLSGTGRLDIAPRGPTATALMIAIRAA